MTFAWYGHLKFRESPLWIVVLASWGIAFFEYCLQVPANRWGYAQFSGAQLKTIQEVITLAVFCGFSVLYLKEPLTPKMLAGFGLIAGGGIPRFSQIAVCFCDKRTPCPFRQGVFIFRTRCAVRLNPMARLQTRSRLWHCAATHRVIGPGTTRDRCGRDRASIALRWCRGQKPRRVEFPRGPTSARRLPVRPVLGTESRRGIVPCAVQAAEYHLCCATYLDRCDDDSRLRI
jgi:uncharacterized protein (DUF486 family)